MEATHKSHDINEAVDRFRSGAHSAVDRTANATVQTADSIFRKSEQLKNAEQEYLQQCLDYIHRKPLTSIAVAIAAGYLLDRILNDH